MRRESGHPFPDRESWDAEKGSVFPTAVNGMQLT